MVWLEDDPAAIQRAWVHLYATWKAQSAHEISYAGLIAEPAREVSRLAAALAVELPEAEIIRLAAELAQMQAPEEGDYDRETLLHPDHRPPRRDRAQRGGHPADPAGLRLRPRGGRRAGTGDSPPSPC